MRQPGRVALGKRMEGRAVAVGVTQAALLAVPQFANLRRVRLPGGAFDFNWIRVLLAVAQPTSSRRNSRQGCLRYGNVPQAALPAVTQVANLPRARLRRDVRFELDTQLAPNSTGFTVARQVSTGQFPRRHPS